MKFFKYLGGLAFTGGLIFIYSTKYKVIIRLELYNNKKVLAITRMDGIIISIEIGI
jgi:hypothetical protein